MGDAVVFTNKVFFISFCRNKVTFFPNFCVKAGNCLLHNGCHLNAVIEIDKMNPKTRNFWITKTVTNMELTYIYGNVLRLRLPTTVAPLHSQSNELVGKVHKWKSSHKRKSCLIRLTLNTNLFISKNLYFTLFSGIKLFFFSLLQTTELYLK